MHPSAAAVAPGGTPSRHSDAGMIKAASGDPTHVGDVTEAMRHLLAGKTYFEAAHELQHRLATFVHAADMAKRNRMRRKLRDTFFTRMNHRFDRILKWAVCPHTPQCLRGLSLHAHSELSHGLQIFKMWREETKASLRRKERSMQWMRTLMERQHTNIVAEVFQAWRIVTQAHTQERLRRRAARIQQ